MANKKQFNHNLQLLKYRIERDGDLLLEAKQMVTPGSTMEFLDTDYKILRSGYIKDPNELPLTTSILTLV